MIWFDNLVRFSCCFCIFNNCWFNCSICFWCSSNWFLNWILFCWFKLVWLLTFSLSSSRRALINAFSFFNSSKADSVILLLVVGFKFSINCEEDDWLFSWRKSRIVSAFVSAWFVIVSSSKSASFIILVFWVDDFFSRLLFFESLIETASSSPSAVVSLRDQTWLVGESIS